MGEQRVEGAEGGRSFAAFVGAFASGREDTVGESILCTRRRRSLALLLSESRKEEDADEAVEEANEEDSVDGALAASLCLLLFRREWSGSRLPSSRLSPSPLSRPFLAATFGASSALLLAAATCRSVTRATTARAERFRR